MAATLPLWIDSISDLLAAVLIVRIYAPDHRDRLSIIQRHLWLALYHVLRRRLWWFLRQHRQLHQSLVPTRPFLSTILCMFARPAAPRHSEAATVIITIINNSNSQDGNTDTTTPSVVYAFLSFTPILYCFYTYTSAYDEKFVCTKKKKDLPDIVLILNGSSRTCPPPTRSLPATSLIPKFWAYYNPSLSPYIKTNWWRCRVTRHEAVFYYQIAVRLPKFYIFPSLFAFYPAIILYNFLSRLTVWWSVLYICTA